MDKKYIILSAYDSEILEKLVEDCISRGYIVQGGVSVTRSPGARDPCTYYQAMVAKWL